MLETQSPLVGARIVTVTPDPQTDAARKAQLHAAARSFEAAFLAEMLEAAGLSRPPDGMDGGMGEDQFRSMLVQAQAKALADNGGIGLAEAVYRTLLQRGAS